MNEYDYIEPVFYCKRCKSLNIVENKQNVLSCKNCKSTDIDVTLLETWMELYKRQYGHYLIENNDTIEEEIKELFDSELDVHQVTNDFLSQGLPVLDVLKRNLKIEPIHLKNIQDGGENE